MEKFMGLLIVLAVLAMPSAEAQVSDDVDTSYIIGAVHNTEEAFLLQQVVIAPKNEATHKASWLPHDHATINAKWRAMMKQRVVDKKLAIAPKMAHEAFHNYLVWSRKYNIKVRKELSMKRRHPRRGALSIAPKPHRAIDNNASTAGCMISHWGSWSKCQNPCSRKAYRGRVRLVVPRPVAKGKRPYKCGQLSRQALPCYHDAKCRGFVGFWREWKWHSGEFMGALKNERLPAFKGWIRKMAGRRRRTQVWRCQDKACKNTLEGPAFMENVLTLKAYANVVADKYQQKYGHDQASTGVVGRLLQGVALNRNGLDPQADYDKTMDALRMQYNYGIPRFTLDRIERAMSHRHGIIKIRKTKTALTKTAWRQDAALKSITKMPVEAVARRHGAILDHKTLGLMFAPRMFYNLRADSLELQKERRRLKEAMYRDWASFKVAQDVPQGKIFKPCDCTGATIMEGKRRIGHHCKKWNGKRDNKPWCVVDKRCDKAFPTRGQRHKWQYCEPKSAAQTARFLKKVRAKAQKPIAGTTIRITKRMQKRLFSKAIHNMKAVRKAFGGRKYFFKKKGKKHYPYQPGSVTHEKQAMTYHKEDKKFHTREAHDAMKNVAKLKAKGKYKKAAKEKKWAKRNIRKSAFHSKLERHHKHKLKKVTKKKEIWVKKKSRKGKHTHASAALRKQKAKMAKRLAAMHKMKKQLKAIKKQAATVNGQVKTKAKAKVAKKPVVALSPGQQLKRQKAKIMKKMAAMKKMKAQLKAIKAKKKAAKPIVHLTAVQKQKAKMKAKIAAIKAKTKAKLDSIKQKTAKLKAKAAAAKAKAAKAIAEATMVTTATDDAALGAVASEETSEEAIMDTMWKTGSLMSVPAMMLQENDQFSKYDYPADKDEQLMQDLEHSPEGKVPMSFKEWSLVNEMGWHK